MLRRQFRGPQQLGGLPLREGALLRRRQDQGL